MNINQYTREYYAENAKKLRSVVDRIIKKFGWITDKDHFYSLANEIFAHDILQNYDGKSDFDSFVYSCLRKKILTEITRMNRDKRMPYSRDKNGKKIKDSDGKYIMIPIISLDAPIVGKEGESFSLEDILKSDFDLEKQIFGEDDTQIDKYLDRLSKLQRKIASLLIVGYEPEEIQEILHITKSKYDNSLENIKAYENISVLFRR